MDTQTPQRCTDACRVMRCQLGDQDAWRELVRLWNPRLIGFFRRMTHDPNKAEDLLQTTWLRLVRTLTRLDQPDRFAPWVYRIAHNTFVDQLRKQHRSPSMMVEDGKVEPTDGECELDRWIESDEIAHAMTVLNAEDRLIINLHYFEHLTVAEVADICQSPAGTIKSRLQRARRELRLQLEKERNE